MNVQVISLLKSWSSQGSYSSIPTTDTYDASNIDIDEKESAVSEPLLSENHESNKKLGTIQHKNTIHTGWWSSAGSLVSKAFIQKKRPSRDNYEYTSMPFRKSVLIKHRLEKMNAKSG